MRRVSSKSRVSSVKTAGIAAGTRHPSNGITKQTSVYASPKSQFSQLFALRRTFPMELHLMTSGYRRSMRVSEGEVPLKITIKS